MGELKKGKDNAATKSEVQKLIRKMNVKRPGKGSIINCFNQRKVSYFSI